MYSLRRCILGVCCALLTACVSLDRDPPGGSRTAALNPAASCAAVHDWVTAHHDQLPRTYEALRAYPANYRIGIFSALSAQERSALWTSHIDAYLRDHPALTRAQRDVLQRAQKLGTPALYGGEPSQVDEEELERQARAVFPRAEFIQIFADLAGHAPAGITQAQGAGIACSCNTGDNYCNINQLCKADACTKAGSGCGWLWKKPCNGRCYLPNLNPDAGATPDDDGGLIEGDNSGGPYGSDMGADMNQPDLASPPDMTPAYDFAMPSYDFASPPDLTPGAGDDAALRGGQPRSLPR